MPNLTKQIKDAHLAIAEVLFNGPNNAARRGPEQIKRDIADALGNAYEAGRLSTHPDAIASALRLQLAVARNREAEVAAEIRRLEAELHAVAR